MKLANPKQAAPASWSAAHHLAAVSPSSARPILGPALNALRRLLWRTLGLEGVLQRYSQQVLTLHAQVQALNQGQPFSFRPGTFDERIFQEVVIGNEYRLPERFDPADVVIDIGTHIGSFCFAALLRGAGHVHGFEAEPSNHALAARNLAAFADRCRIHNRAVWRSDRKGDVLHFYAPPVGEDDTNTGGGNVMFPVDGIEIQTVPLDDVLREVTENGRRRVRFLKIDCEGAEFPILLTSRLLHWIDQINGEFHELNGAHNRVTLAEQARIPGVERFTMDVLAAHLRTAGFAVEDARNGDSNLGWFFATYLGARQAESGPCRQRSTETLQY